jgi:CRP-like cAMP-binding protein
MSADLTLHAACSALLEREGLDPAHAARLCRMLARAEDRQLDAGEVLFVEGEPGETAAILVEGSVRVTSLDARGAPRELAILKAPMMLGHVTMVDTATRSATVKTLGPVRCISISRATYETWVNTDGLDGDLFRDLILGCMFRQLARSTEDLSRLTFLSNDDPVDVG